MPDVLNTAMYLPFGKRGVSRGAAEAALIQDLVCYDAVWILTDQMSAIPRLVEIMGIGAFEGAVKDGTLRFVHDRHILIWPQMQGYRGVVPYQAIASMPGGISGEGFSQLSTRDRATLLLKPYIPDFKHVRTLAATIETSTTEFVTLDFSAPRVDAHEAMLTTLRIYESVVSAMEGYPLTRRDIARLRRDLEDPRRTPMRTRTYKVMTLQQSVGPDSLAAEEEIPSKQLGMLNLALADRFLKVHSLLDATPSLHSEPAVGQVLEARMEAVRKAAGPEVDALLRAERVYLPVLSQQGGTFPYEELLKARRSAAGAAFRNIVARRDLNPTAELIQEYLNAIGNPIVDRLDVAASRALTTTILGLVNPLLGVVATAADTFGVGKVLGKAGARYYVDRHLRRIGEIE